MTDIMAEKARALLSGATPGTWWFDNNEGYGANAIHAPHKSDPRAYESVAHAIGDSAEAEANAQLIATAPDLARAYIAQAARIEAADKLAEACTRLRKIMETQLRTADFHREGCKCPRCAEDAIYAALSAYEGING